MDQTITPTDLNNLATKLDELSEVLTQKEKDLLVAVFKLAGQAIETRLGQGTDSGKNQTESGAVGKVATLNNKDLSNGFKGAFKSIGTKDFNLRGGIEEVAGGVGIGIIW